MDGLTRRSRFERRIETERLFLASVNEIFGYSAPLAGMTHDAIRSWGHRAGLVTRGDISQVVSLLLEISSRADLMADNSKDVFEPDDRPRPDALAELRNLLASSLEPHRSRLQQTASNAAAQHAC